MSIIFYNETKSNGKIQVMTTETLTGKGIKNYGGCNIVQHNNELHFNNMNYWVSKSAFDNLKNNFNLIRVCF